MTPHVSVRMLVAACLLVAVALLTLVYTLALEVNR